MRLYHDPLRPSTRPPSDDPLQALSLFMERTCSHPYIRLDAHRHPSEAALTRRAENTDHQRITESRLDQPEGAVGLNAVKNAGRGFEHKAPAAA